MCCLFIYLEIIAFFTQDIDTGSHLKVKFVLGRFKFNGPLVCYFCLVRKYKTSLFDIIKESLKVLLILF